MTNNVSFKKYLFSLLIAAAVAVMGFFDISAYYFGAIVIAFIGISWGLSCAAIPGVISCICLIAVGVDDLYSLFCILIPFILTIVILSAGFKQRMAYRYIALMLAFLFVVALYAGLCLPSVLEGEPAYAAIKEFLMAADEEMRLLLDQQTSDFALIAEYIEDAIYFILIFEAELLAFLAVVIMKGLCACAKTPIRPMARFADWELPESLRYGIPILAAGCIAMSLTGYYAAAQVTAAVCGLILPLVFIEGFACVMFLLTTNFRVAAGGKRNSRTLVMILLLITSLFLPMVFIIAGIIELYARRRPKLRRINAKIMAAFDYAVSNNRDVVEVDFEDGRGPQIIATRKRRNDDEIFFDNDLKIDDDAAEPSGSEDKPDTDSDERQALDNRIDDHEEDKK